MTDKSPPAFPISSIDGFQPGMSLRDYFAGYAMRAVMIDDSNQTHSDIAKFAYKIADAMPAEREQS